MEILLGVLPRILSGFNDICFNLNMRGQLWIVIFVLVSTIQGSAGVSTNSIHRSGSNQSIRTLKDYSRANKVHKSHDTIQVQYGCDQLLQLRLSTLHNHALRKMHPKTVSKIRELKIQKKRKHAPRDKNKNKWQRPTSINLNSLAHIDCHAKEKLKQHRTNFKLMLLNAQSIRNKDTMICDYIMDNKIDVTLIMETWITDQDQIWLDCCDFKQHGLNIDTSNRQQRKGGGLALISRSNIIVKHLKKSLTRSFEYAIWKINTGKLQHHYSLNLSSTLF